MTIIPSYYCKRGFDSPGLEISAGLAGLEHRFVFHGAPARVLLPAREEAASIHEDTRLAVTSWTTSTNEHRQYLVRRLTITVEATDPGQIADLLAAVPRRLGQPIAVGMPGTEKLEPVIDALSTTAKDAIEHWFRVVRWRTMRWTVGRRRRQSATASSASLYGSPGDALLLCDSIKLTASGGDPLTVAEWSDIQDALTDEQESPLYYDLYFDGQEHYVDGDYRRAVIDYAIACEVLLKTLLEHEIPESLPKVARRHLLGAPVRQLLGKEFLRSLIGDEWTVNNQHLLAALRQLFDARNSVMHDHHPRALSGQQCRAFSVAAATFLAAGSGRLRENARGMAG